jgi:predicted HAD superfamily Cof-like phosphohydrolase
LISSGEVIHQRYDPVSDLHEWFFRRGITPSRTPTLRLADDVKHLRVSLIADELSELRGALEEDDLVGVADALADLLYVVYGAAVLFGIPIEEVFAEVHRSNLSKLEGSERAPTSIKVGKGSHFRPPDVDGILHQAQQSE